MKHFARSMVAVLVILLVSSVPNGAARAQDSSCALEFTTAEPDYKHKYLRVIWLAEGPAVDVALQIYQDGTVVDPETGADWRYFDLAETAQALLDVSNLRSGAFMLRAMMLDGSQTPCKTHDGNLYVANAELKWDPRRLQFEVFPDVPDYDANSVSAQVLIDGARQDVMYSAHLMLDGKLVGSSKGIGSDNPFVIEIPMSRDTFDLRDLKETKETELTVAVGYSADAMTSVTKTPKIGPARQVGLMERLGDILLAVLNNPPIVMAILLVFGVMIVFQSTHRPNNKTPKRRTDKTDVRAQDEPAVNGPAAEFHAVPAVRARVVQNGDRTHEIVANLKEFPLIFGRNKFLEHGQIVEVEGCQYLNLRDDRAVSRNHFQIVRTGQQLGLNVLSPNGATVNERMLRRSETVHISLTESTEVKIGELTKIELTPIYLT